MRRRRFGQVANQLAYGRVRAGPDRIHGGISVMNDDEMKGNFDKVKGRVKEAVGDLTDDERLRGEGAGDQIKGKAEESYGSARRKVGEALNELGRKIKR
jgi:uncharacterized protein YjbJ (UPF0337 family)